MRQPPSPPSRNPATRSPCITSIVISRWCPAPIHVVEMGVKLQNSDISVRHPKAESVQYRRVTARAPLPLPTFPPLDRSQHRSAATDLLLVDFQGVAVLHFQLIQCSVSATELSIFARKPKNPPTVTPLPSATPPPPQEPENQREKPGR